ncbi:MAG: hypothetical protein ACI9EF_003367 [Pseudohongiellaceae bacterium]|jgi:hypothetical protein
MSRSTLTTCALLAALVPTAVGQQFSRDAAALSSPNTWTNGVAVADLDGDGDYDLAFSNGSTYGGGGAQPQRMYLNDGSGNFSDASGQLNVANFNAQMVIADDCDLDGDLDLIYAPSGPYPSTTKTARILINDGSGNFADESGARMPATTMSSWSVVAADLDDDGDNDLCFTDGCLGFSGAVAQAHVFYNDGTGNYTDVTGGNMPADTYNCHDIICFDYDLDGDIDIALSGKGAAGKRARLWVNDGSGNFSVSTVLDGLGTTNTYEIDWSDADGDGDWDAFVQSVASTNEGWGRNNGISTPPTETTFSGGNGNDDNELASMDYDMDGDMDAFVGSLSANREKVYQQDASHVFNRVNIFTQLTDSTLDFSFGDFDGDGRHDVVTAQGESGTKTNKIYDNTGPIDNLPPVFTNTDAPAISAGTTVFHAVIQDNYMDDGIGPTLMSYDYESFAGGSSESSGSGISAWFQGGGQYRAPIATTASTDGIRVTWQASDDVGNVSAPEVIEVGNVGGGSAWTDLGGALAGTTTPLLTGSGPLTDGSANSVDLSNALAGSTTNLVIGLSLFNVPFKGGVLGPAPDFLFFSLPVSGAGDFNLPFVWPAVGPGFTIWVQHWVSDAGGPVGFSASNMVRGISQ